MGFAFWFAGVLFTIGFVILGGETGRLREISGEKVMLALFAFVIWPLMLGVALRERCNGEGGSTPDDDF